MKITRSDFVTLAAFVLLATGLAQAPVPPCDDPPQDCGDHKPEKKKGKKK